MYVPFQGATSLPLKLTDNPQYSYNGSSIPEISASAARAKDGKLYLALVNTNPTKDAEVAVDVPGQSVKSVNGRVLTSAAMDTHNTFQSPEAIKPAPYNASAGGSSAHLNG